jgi:hypothetical protein
MRFEWCTFVGNQDTFSFDATGIGAGCGVLVSHCDFRDIADASKFALDILQTSALTTQTRRVEYCTFLQTDAPALSPMKIKLGGTGLSFVHNVCSNVIVPTSTTTTTTEDNLWHFNEDGIQFFTNGTSWKKVVDNYFMYEGGGHPRHLMSKIVSFLARAISCAMLRFAL